MTKQIKAQPKPENPFADFASGVNSELKQITWTDPEELKSYTWIVVIATFLLGILIYCMDLIIRIGLEVFSNVLRLITG